MGLLSAMFGGKPTARKILKSVETVERLLNGDSAGAIDQTRLPIPREQFKQLLLEEIGRFYHDPKALGATRRYARCYVDLSAFQPRLDRNDNSQLAQALRAAGASDVMALADRHEFREELRRAGYDSLL